MSRSGYVDGFWDDDDNTAWLYRGAVQRAIQGKRGQAFLREMLEAMDAMPEKKLASGVLVGSGGEVCAMGAVVKARGLDVTGLDIEDRDAVGAFVGIAPSLAAEIAFENDEAGDFGSVPDATPEARWVRMRGWIQANLLPATKETP